MLTSSSSSIFGHLRSNTKTVHSMYGRYMNSLPRNSSTIRSYGMKQQQQLQQQQQQRSSWNKQQYRTAVTDSTAKTANTPPPSPQHPPEVGATQKKTGWWYSAELWGGAGALAGWGMSGSAS
jgi:hypothetical protein